MSREIYPVGTIVSPALPSSFTSIESTGSGHGTSHDQLKKKNNLTFERNPLSLVTLTWHSAHSAGVGASTQTVCTQNPDLGARDPPAAVVCSLST